MGTDLWQCELLVPYACKAQSSYDLSLDKGTHNNIYYYGIQWWRVMAIANLTTKSPGAQCINLSSSLPLSTTAAFRYCTHATQWHVCANQSLGFVCLGFSTLVASKVMLEWIPTCNSQHFWWIHSAAPLRQHEHCWYHDLISHSVTLSWFWASHSLLYPRNAECQARSCQAM